MAPLPPLQSLTPFERATVRLARAANRAPWVRLCAALQRQVGARWIGWCIDRLLHVEGLDHVAGTDRSRPLLLVANHRSFFDLFVAMSVLYRRVPGWTGALFPVRGRYYYQRVGGVLLNACVANWAMYPPFFHDAARRRFDAWALEELAALCREGPGRLVGFHPEGTRNRDPDPWSLAPAQSGVGRLLHQAEPQVVPLFIGGLGNSLPDVLRRDAATGEPIRLWFGPPLEYRAMLAAPSNAATYRELTAHVMAAIAQQAERDRSWMRSRTR